MLGFNGININIHVQLYLFKRSLVFRFRYIFLNKEIREEFRTKQENLNELALSVEAESSGAGMSGAVSSGSVRLSRRLAY